MVRAGRNETEKAGVFISAPENGGKGRGLSNHSQKISHLRLHAVVVELQGIKIR